MLFRGRKASRYFILLLILLHHAGGLAQLCREWGEPKLQGQLPFHPLREASGLVLSRSVPDRYYWINDSGDNGRLHFTRPDGKGAHTVEVTGFKPHDPEALSLTRCDGNACIVIADIGDNRGRRKTIELVFVKEQKEFGKTAPVHKRLKLRYPDGAHDAEGLAFLPNGDLIIASKELSLFPLRSAVTSLYTLSASRIENAGRGVQTLRKLGGIPLPDWLPEDGVLGQAVSDMAVNFKRQVLGLLTYNRAVEIPLARLSELGRARNWKRDRDFSVVPVKTLTQQEALAYNPNVDQIIWSTEFLSLEAPIFSMTCGPVAP
ncbi:MAG: hypothetical protein AB7G93_22385 [Bdellovibrionales bacterium]